MAEPYDPVIPQRFRREVKRSEGTRGVDGRAYPPDVEAGLNLLVAKVLGTPDGERLLAYLRNLTMNVAYDGEVPTSRLLHMEGQRWLVGVLVQRLKKGNEP